ncbi:CDP-alcohol phosphatidyltransferase family protein [Goodfellowiella coeruleoviolacea]|uniref:CDP-diacylglycerol--glycerol-3-phosphate 3-phosphatidyltransferase n=1 Tax=Goodfellowiella coeruleoviolacea TaxID=334858 RepID=A0AAE3KEF1_9PSEU|nr:CDP-alcohol phosphatidyltransferase family protein [Goodfellowiella coeruleoviolacea]MCP2163837.1 CDP-diacylglycerol--glycerol-3-phosphate 3-phosphatidyltransferase [Goodfellowiella coeruleoviolacea]
MAQAGSARARGDQDPRDRVLTIPNALSVLRLAGVPLFLWLLLGPHADAWALVVLALSAVTDWLDGKLARWLNQTSRFGMLLDPAADRLYIMATLVAFVVRDILPWWAAAILIGRELAVGACLPILRRAGYGPFEVHYIGKAATFCLLYALPLLLLGEGDGVVAQVARPIAYAFTVWGGALYVWSGVLYVAQLVAALRRAGGNRPAVAGRGRAR